jgi:hypothetical protein
MNNLTLDDILQRRPRVIALVVSEQKGQEWHYKRMVGRILTNYVITDSPLRKGEVNQFRSKPTSFVALFTALMSKVEEK